MDAMNTMSNLEFMLIQQMAKDSMKEIQGECALICQLRNAGLSRPGLVEQATTMFKNAYAKLNRHLHRKYSHSHPTPGDRYAI